MSSEFSFSLTSCLTKAEEPSLSYYLPIAGGRIIGFITFPRVLVLCEMLSVSSRIWTRVTVSISHDDNHYTTGTLVVSWSYNCLQNIMIINNFKPYEWFKIVRFVWVLWHFNHCRLFNAKSSLYIYKYMICKHIVLITLLNEPWLFFCILLNIFKHCYQIRTIVFTINHLLRIFVSFYSLLTLVGHLMCTLFIHVY